MFSLTLGLLLFLASSSAIASDATMPGTGDMRFGADRTDIFTEGFEIGSFPPEGWTRLHFGDGFVWFRTSSQANSGTYSAYVGFGPEDSLDEWMVTPALDFSGLAEPILEWYEQGTNWLANGGHHMIMASTTVPDDPGAFSIVWDMTPADHTINGFGNAPASISLADLAGEPTVYIAFRYLDDPGPHDFWYIDDIRVYQLLFDHDVYAYNVTPNGQQYGGGEVITPRVWIGNDGQNTETFDVTMEVDESGTVVYSEVLTVTNLASDTSTMLTFPNFTVTNLGHLITLRATTQLANDQNIFNDTAEAYNNTYTQQRVPMCILFTNWGCGPCVSANQTLDAYMPGQGNDVALMRVHVSWPSGSDPMYLANPSQSGTLVVTYGVTGVPDFFVDGLDASVSPALINLRKQVNTTSTIDLAWDPDSEELTVVLDNIETIAPGGNYRLFTVITEDNIHALGPNGEPVHHQAFRRMYPSTDGSPVSTDPGTHQYSIDCTLGGGWIYNNLRATAYIQDVESFEIMQAATNFLTEIEPPDAVGDQVVTPFELDSNYPNPFNPSTTIKFSLPSDQMVELSIIAVDGSRVATLLHESLPAGTHQVIWDGRNEKGVQVASGTYFYQIKAGGHSATKRMMLVK
jgi:hypothetical protein